MSDPNWRPKGFEGPEKCPPCNGACLTSAGCSAAGENETTPGDLLLVAAVVIAVFVIVTVLVWPQ